jgi:hypothetical protein
MPWNAVMGKWKSGELHSGSKSGPPVDNQKQAVAIMLSEKRKADQGDKEYQAPRRRLPKNG